jgi:tetratricopeptide (TPR) repeat protein
MGADMRIRRRRIWLASAAALVTILGGAWTGSAQTASDPRLLEAEQLTSQGEWDRAIDKLTELIQQIGAAPISAESRTILVAAYEKRALAHLQVGHQPDARVDFAALLQLAPNHAISGPSPGIISFFEDTRRSTLAVLDLAIAPNDATISLEGEKLPVPPGSTSPAVVSAGRQWLPAGHYRLTVRRPGYEEVTQDVELVAGRAQSVPIKLSRTSAVLFIRTVPAGVHVLIDGADRGVTQADLAGSERSQMLAIDGLEPRSMPYRVRFEKACYVPAAETFTVLAFDAADRTNGSDPSNTGPDRYYDGISLRRSFGTLDVTADQPDAVVFIDGESRGKAGQPITDVCSGEHAVDVRAATGRFSQRVQIEFGKTATVKGTLLPAFALRYLPAQDAQGPDQKELARSIDLLRTKNVRFMTVDSPVAARGSTKSTEVLLTEANSLMQQFDTQGVAALTRVAPAADGDDLELTLLARGSSRPDVLRWSTRSQPSVQRVIDRLDLQIPVVRTSLGIDAVDVLRMDGAVVAAVDPTGPSNGLIAAGDVIVGIGTSSISSVQDLVTLLSAMNDATATVRLRDKNPVTVSLARVPAVVNARDDLPFNVVATELRARLARQQMVRSVSPEDTSAQAIRLNIGVALMALGNCELALQMFNEVKLENRRGVSRGTLDYLKGMCFKQSGQLAEARAHFERASKEPDAVLTEGGPTISHLALLELGQMGQTTR